MEVTTKSRLSSSLRHFASGCGHWISSRFSTRDQTILTAAWVVLTIATIWPLLTCRYVPGQDTPCHLSVVQVWRSLHSDPVVHAYYRLRPGHQPYIVHYALLRFLGGVMSLELANRIILIAYAVALPLSVAHALRRFGRDPRAALLSFAFVYNPYFIFGFISNLLALPILFFTIGELRAYLEKPTLVREVAIALLFALTAATHVLVFGALAMASMVVFFAHVRGIKEILRRSVFVWPTVLPLFLWSSHQTSGKPIDGNWLTIKENLSQFSGWTTNIFKDGSDEFLFVVVLVSLGLLLLVPVRSLSDVRPRSWSMPAAGLLLFVAFLSLPFEMKNPSHWATNVRLVIPSFLLLLGLPQAHLRSWKQLVLLPGLLGIVWYDNDLLTKFREYDKATRDIDAVIAAVPPDKKVLPLVYDETDGVHQGSVYRHIFQLYQVRKGGYLPEGFTKANGAHTPVVQTRPLPAPFWKKPRSFRYGLHGKPYDYFLVVYPKRLRRPWKSFPGAGKHVRLIAHRGRFAAYVNLKN